MRLWIFSALSACCLAALGVGQTIEVKAAKPSPPKAEMPLYRPILLGAGPEALVNRIKTETLIKGGQKDGMVMFTCFVDKTGKMVESAIYRASANSDLLQQELKRRLVDAVFTPAVYKREPVSAVYYGTVTFVVVQGKPRLRIFSNQEYPELKKESDFIGPQPIFGSESKFSGLHYPPAAAAQVPVAGIADIQLKVDESGNVEWMSVVGEHPPLIGFGAEGLLDLDGAKFIPAFRGGKPVSAEVTLPLYYPQP